MKTILIIQGVFYLTTGLWPLLSMRSFEAITGPKTDKWLVKMVGLLVICSGIIFLWATRNESIPSEVILLAILNCISFIVIDVYYAFRGIIRKVYLADALVELIFILSYAGAALI